MERVRQSQIIAGLFDRLAKERFYGHVEVRFEGGQVVCLKQETSLKLEDVARLVR